MDTGTSRKGFGSLIAVAVIIVLIIIGGLYFWGGKMAPKPVSGVIDQTAAVAPVSVSDDVSSLEADLSATATAPDTSALDSLQ
jgi:hypothetical protein